MITMKFLLEKALPLGRKLLVLAVLILFYWLWDPGRDWRGQLTLAVVLGGLIFVPFLISLLLVISWARIPNARRGAIFLYCTVTILMVGIVAWAALVVDKTKQFSPFDRPPVWVLER